MMISQELIRARLQRGFTQTDVARKSGHGVSTIHDLESGKNRNPGFLLLGDVCLAPGISLDELYAKTRKENKK